MKAFGLSFGFIVLFFLSSKISFGQSCEQNYIKTTVVKTAGVKSSTDIDTLSIKNKSVTINYFDGLGRSSQIIHVNSSPSQKDIIQPIFYDEFGRESKKYLPYTKDNGGLFVEDPLQDINDFHQTPNSFSELVFESSPLNRIKEQIPEGDTWKSGNKSIKINYKTNSELEVIKWKVQDNNCVNSGYYNSSSLYVTETEDENSNKSRVYKDPYGNVILISSLNGGYWLKTYYVYDDFDLLRFVISPKASKEIESGCSFNQLSDKLCYSYVYDYRKRMIKKKLPGADTVYMVYDKRDMLILTQDGNLKGKNKWLFTKYDVFKRPALTGIYEDSTSFYEMLTKVNTASSLWDNYDDTQNQYTNNAFPNITQNCEILTVTFYDSYDYVENLPNDSIYNYKNKYSVEAESGIGLKQKLTATLTYVLDHSEVIDKDSLLTIKYYDEYGRVIQITGDNHKGGFDIVHSKYNFAGELMESSHEHTINNIDIFTIDKKAKYDHSGRLLATDENFNNSGWVRTSQLEYNEKGELITKKLHSKDSTSFLQEINYDYNIRGWMTLINNPDSMFEKGDYFAMRMKYSDGNTPQYNGNLSSIEWLSSKFINPKKYNFVYDSIYRLSTANYTGVGNYDASYKYDYNSNITQLNRHDKVNENYEEIDDLTYEYDGNQLISVEDYDDPVHNVNGFLNNSSLEIEYLYDANGNMIKDENKYIVNIDYNHLNLPDEIEIAPNSTHFITYTYDAVGNKLRKSIDNDQDFVDYVGSFIYVNNQLMFIISDYGKIIKLNDSTYERHYNIADHLGNIRTTFSENDTITQVNSYFPFGMIINGLSYLGIGKEFENKHLYNNKELQDEFDLLWYDYGRRMYDGVIGRFHVQDRFTEKYFSLSPYQYTANNPINSVDINGDSIYIRYKTKERRTGFLSNVFKYKTKRHTVTYTVGMKEIGNEFADKVIKSLNDTHDVLSKAEGNYFQNMVSELANKSDDVYKKTIKQTSGTSGGAPSSRFIKFNPNKTIEGKHTFGKSKLLPTAGALAHEVGHNYLDFKLGARKSNRYHHNMIVPDIENVLAKEWETGYRRHYNDWLYTWNVDGIKAESGTMTNFSKFVLKIRTWRGKDY